MVVIDNVSLLWITYSTWFREPSNAAASIFIYWNLKNFSTYRMRWPWVPPLAGPVATGKFLKLSQWNDPVWVTVTVILEENPLLCETLKNEHLFHPSLNWTWWSSQAGMCWLTPMPFCPQAPCGGRMTFVNNAVHQPQWSQICHDPALLKVMKNEMRYEPERSQSQKAQSLSFTIWPKSPSEEIWGSCPK